MKKSLVSLLALLFTASLAACGGPSAKAVPAPTAEPTSASVTIAVAAPSPKPVAEPTETPAPTPKVALSISEIAAGTYTGTLSGDSYTSTEDEEAYSISPDISPAEITVTFKDGQVELYSAASATADGTVFGTEVPRSPTYTQTVSGALSLRQIDEATIRAEGDITSPSESTYIYWDGNNQFDRWEIIAKDHTHHCTVSITMAYGVPTAEITVNGTSSHRTATVPLQLKEEAS